MHNYIHSIGVSFHTVNVHFHIKILYSTSFALALCSLHAAMGQLYTAKEIYI